VLRGRGAASALPSTGKACLLAVAAALCLLPPAVAAADDVLEGSAVNRRVPHYRAGRHEVSGVLASTLGDPYVHTVLPGVRYDLHLFEWLAVGGHLQVGIPIRTAMSEEIEAKVMRSNENFAMEASSLLFLAGGQVSVAPLVGKMLLFEDVLLNFDVHLDLSLALAGVTSNGTAIKNGLSLAPGAGGGFRLFLTDVMALCVNLNEVFVDRTLSVNRDNKARGSTFQGSTVASVGFSFFMPPKLRRSE
jgi:hypothetical protein